MIPSLWEMVCFSKLLGNSITKLESELSFLVPKSNTFWCFYTFFLAQRQCLKSIDTRTNYSRPTLRKNSREPRPPALEINHLKSKTFFFLKKAGKNSKHFFCWFYCCSHRKKQSRLEKPNIYCCWDIVLKESSIECYKGENKSNADLII